MPAFLKIIRNCVMAILAAITGCSESPKQEWDTPSPTRHPDSEVLGDSVVNPMLLKLFREHGLKVTERDSWIYVGDDPRIRGTVVREEEPSENIKSVQIDILLELEPGRVLVESFGGFGTTREEAVADGIFNFVANSFHVLLSAFYAESGRVESEQWVINGKPRKVIIGEMGIRGSLPNPDKPPIEWFKTLENEIKASALPAGTHWIRCYYAQTQNQTLATEVLLDNDEWKVVQSKMANVQWPKAEEFYSTRIFLVIQDVEEP